MSNELLERARALTDAATPGPWKFFDAYDIVSRPGQVGARRFGTNEDTVIEASRYGYDEINVSEADAAFIAQSRELVPALCAALEAAEAALEAAEAALAEVVNVFDNGFWDGYCEWADIACDALEPRE